MTTPAGWYPDPTDASRLLYWGGNAWTGDSRSIETPAPTQFATGAVSTGDVVPWWQSWPVIILSLIVCCPVGLVALWLRRTTSTGIKAAITVAVVAVVVLVGALTPSNDTDSQTSPEPTSTPSPTPSATPTKPQSVRTPDVAGLSLSNAKSQLDDAGLRVVISREPSGQKTGSVINQRPDGGTKIKEGASVTLVVASRLPKVPNVVGKSQSNAERILQKAGFQVLSRQEATSSASPGDVIRQSPSGGTQRQPGSRVTITVAKKPPTTTTQPSNCTPGYSPCLPPASDYDCAGGTGDGPQYTGPVRVTGSDPYDLDSDGDGYGCESS